MIDLKLKGLLGLIQRSADIGDGWRQVSDVLWPHVQDAPGELVELDDIQKRIRLTSEGSAVLTYS